MPKRRAPISRSCRATVYGKPLVYLDSGASAQKPRVVLDAMRDFAASEYANVHRGVHFLSAAATDRYEAARRTVQKFLNAAREDEIVFTKGGTEAINLVSYSYLAPLIQPGDEIVLTVMEHHSNIVPWHFLRERAGAVLRWVDVRDDGSLDIEALDAAITAKTKLVAITHMSNVLGTVTPLKEIVARAHAKGVPVLADGCQGAVHEIVDVQALDIDFYAITGHKLYGPTGIGALYAKRAHLKAMRPFNGGGEMIREVTRDAITYADPPARFEAGTPPIIETVGLAAALDYLIGASTAPRSRRMSMICWPMPASRCGQFNWLQGDRRCPGQGRNPVIRGRGDACPRPRHHIGPGRRGGPRRPSLRPAADGAVRRGLDQPGQFRALQHARRCGCADRGPGQGARDFG